MITWVHVMNKYFTVLVFIFIILFTSPMWTLVHADDVNYCHDKASWKKWDELIKKHPHDMDIQMLHAVRIGFCKKIEDGSITFEMASEAFNHLHKTVLQRAHEKKEQWLKDKQL